MYFESLPGGEDNWSVIARPLDNDTRIEFSPSHPASIFILPSELVTLDLKSLGLEDRAAARLRGVPVSDYRRQLRDAAKAVGAQTHAEATTRAILAQLIDAQQEAAEVEIHPDDLLVGCGFALGYNHYRTARMFGLEIADVRYCLTRLRATIGNQEPTDAVRRLFVLGKFAMAPQADEPVQLNATIVVNRADKIALDGPFRWDATQPRLTQLPDLVEFYEVGDVPLSKLELPPLERDILTLRGNGMSKEEVQQALVISRRKLNKNTTSLLSKMDATNMPHAIGIASGVVVQLWKRGAFRTTVVESKIIRSLAQGRHNAEMMVEVGIKREEDFTDVMDALLQKFQARNREHLVRLALRPGRELLSEK